MEDVNSINTLANMLLNLFKSLKELGPEGKILLIVIFTLSLLAFIIIVANLSSISTLELIFKEKKFETYRQISIDLILGFMFFICNIIFISDSSIIKFSTGLIVLGWSLYFLGKMISWVLQRTKQDKWIKPILNKIKHHNFHYIITSILLSPIAIIVLQSTFILDDSEFEKRVFIYCMVALVETLFTHLCMSSIDAGESFIQLISNGETLYYLCKPDNEVILCGDNKTVDKSNKIVPITVKNLKKGDYVLKKTPYKENEIDTDMSPSSYMVITDAKKIDSFIKSNSYCDVDLSVFDGSKSLLKYVVDGNIIYMFFEKNDQLRGSGHSEPLSLGIACIRKKEYFSGVGTATLYYRNTNEYNNLIASTAILKKHENEITNSNHIISVELDKEYSKLENYYTKTTYVYYNTASESEIPVTE